MVGRCAMVVYCVFGGVLCGRAVNCACGRAVCYDGVLCVRVVYFVVGGVLCVILVCCVVGWCTANHTVHHHNTQYTAQPHSTPPYHARIIHRPTTHGLYTALLRSTPPYHARIIHRPTMQYTAKKSIPE